jgi:signal transduction histidine kinase/CheY-like chemotaxis protein
MYRLAVISTLLFITQAYLLINLLHINEGLSHILVVNISIGSLSIILMLMLYVIIIDDAKKLIKDAKNKRLAFRMNEQNQIRRVLHDLKQPVALITNLAEEDNIDRELISSICMQLSTRVKSLNEDLDHNENTRLKSYVLRDINTLLGNLCKGYSRIFTSRLVDFKFETTVPNDIYVYVLHDKIERAVENLLSNANKFTSEGDSVILRISSTEIDTIGSKNKIMLHICVEDNGKGLTDIDIKNMWKEDYKGQIDSIGSGIGLASIMAFARSEGGKTWSYNNTAHGCTVGFSILGDVEASENLNLSIRGSLECVVIHPIVVNHKSTVSSTKGKKITLFPRKNSFEYRRNSWTQDDYVPVRPEPPKKASILIVEDDALQRRISHRKMRKYTLHRDYQIDTAIDGAAGLKMMRDHSYDAVVSDMNMPIMDGATMLQSAREEMILPPIFKLLSAQTFDKAYFERFGIPSRSLYEKTDVKRNVFKDVAYELLQNIMFNNLPLYNRPNRLEGFKKNLSK